jgi:hypothetical protein
MMFIIREAYRMMRDGSIAGTGAGALLPGWPD